MLSTPSGSLENDEGTKTIPRGTTVRLTEREKRLLAYPPTHFSWYCDQCAAVNSGTPYRTWCAICRAPKPRSPKLVWPDYEAARAKAEKGADPSTKRDQEAKDVAQRLPQRASRAHRRGGKRSRAQ